MESDTTKKNGTSSEVHSSNKSPWLSVLNELYVDLLGSLVPGLFTVILGCGMTFLTLSAVYSMKIPSTSLGRIIEGVFAGDKPFLSSIHYEIGIITLVSAYVVGAAFFRQDPKKPDRTSALFVWIGSSESERLGLAVQSGLKSSKNIPTVCQIWQYILAFIFPADREKLFDLDVQFPYSHIKCYLAARGLIHLLPYIPWCPCEKDFHEKSKFFRTKMFINILKIRLQSFTPELCRDIVRNEAHVRLATSVWYASRCLFLLSVGCIVILLASIYAFKLPPSFEVLSLPFTLNILVASLCIVMKYQLTKCIHYMRVREVVYVLETANLADQICSDFKIDDLTDKNTTHNCSGCDKLTSQEHDGKDGQC